MMAAEVNERRTSMTTTVSLAIGWFCRRFRKMRENFMESDNTEPEASSIPPGRPSPQRPDACRVHCRRENRQRDAVRCTPTVNGKKWPKIESCRKQLLIDSRCRLFGLCCSLGASSQTAAVKLIADLGSIFNAECQLSDGPCSLSSTNLATIVGLPRVSLLIVTSCALSFARRRFRSVPSRASFVFCR